MDIFITVIQIIIGLGILNVWFLRFHKATRYRGGSAKNMKEEFASYGLPEWSVFVIGFLKVLFALMLLAGVFLPCIVLPAATGLGLLMLGAVIMHLKVGDPPIKFVPAGVMLLLCVIVAIYSASCTCLAS